MGKYKYIFFDVAGTLLHKPSLFLSFREVMHNFNYHVELYELKLKHKIISEATVFPDVTNKGFYNKFNAEVLYSLGILPNEEILEELFKKCSYLPWEKFDDVHILSQLNLPIGIISNFNKSLKSKLNHMFGPVFSEILVSEELGVAKPELMFYRKAIEKVKINPNEILYIGDSVKLDIEPAQQVGMTPLLVDREGFYAQSRFRIESLEDIKKFLEKEF